MPVNAEIMSDELPSLPDLNLLKLHFFYFSSGDISHLKGKSRIHCDSGEQGSGITSSSRRELCRVLNENLERRLLWGLPFTRTFNEAKLSQAT